MQVHQPASDSQSVSSLNGMAQNFSPPPSLLSPGHFPYNLNAGGNEAHQEPRKSSSRNGMAQHFSPPPSLLSPGHFPYKVEGGRQSHSPNNSNTHACSYNQCSASFPTLELLEKHEMIQHSSGATNVVSWSFIKFVKFGNKVSRFVMSNGEHSIRFN